MGRQQNCRTLSLQYTLCNFNHLIICYLLATVKSIQSVQIKTLGFAAYPDKGAKNTKVKLNLSFDDTDCKAEEKKSALYN